MSTTASSKSATKSAGKNTICGGYVISNAFLLAFQISVSCIVLFLVGCAAGEKQRSLPETAHPETVHPEAASASELPSNQVPAYSLPQAAGQPFQARQRVKQSGPEQQLRIEPLTQADPSQTNVTVWPTIDSVDTAGIDTTTETEDQLVVNDAYDYAREQLQDDVPGQIPRAPQDQTASNDDNIANSGYVPPSVTRSQVNSSLDSDTHELAPVASLDGGFVSIAYHRIGHDNSPYTVNPRLFAAHMRYLHENGYHTLTLTELDDYLSGRIDLPLRSVLISVDDGHQSSYSQIHPVLLRYGFNALYFPYSDYINNGGLTRRMMRTMLSDGAAEFGVHTKTHAALTLQRDTETDVVYEERVRREIQEPGSLLKELVNPAFMTIAYPYGKVNRQVERLSKTVGMRFGFTVNCAANTRRTNPLRLNRCTIGSQDDLDLFATKLLNPRLALRIIASRENNSGVAKASRSSSLGRIGAPEFLGNLADREFFTGIPIQPFSPYFIDPDGEILVYSAPGLPEGLSIDRHSGTISGVPLAATNISGLTITATNQSGTTSRTNAFDLIVH